jgi:dUTP pyrophosphatase
MKELKVRRLSATAHLPRRGTRASAGYDLYADEDALILPGDIATVSVGISVEIPEGCYGRIAERSSVALKHIAVKGGVIDSDYRGPVGVILENTFRQEERCDRHRLSLDMLLNREKYGIYKVEKGDRIAQLIIEKIATPEVVEVLGPLSETDRGEKGFGSTGN